MKPRREDDDKTVTERRIEVLRNYYDVKGDGVAHARIERLASSREFQESVNTLAEAEEDSQGRRRKHQQYLKERKNGQ